LQNSNDGCPRCPSSRLPRADADHRFSTHIRACLIQRVEEVKAKRDGKGKHGLAKKKKQKKK
jgi:hypothetical protein